MFGEGSRNGVGVFSFARYVPGPTESCDLLQVHCLKKTAHFCSSAFAPCVSRADLLEIQSKLQGHDARSARVFCFA